MSALRAFTMPKWGIEMVEGIVAEWHVNQGESVTRGQVMVGIETDKIVNEVEAEYDAVCLRRIANEGETLPVGALLAVFGEAGTPEDAVDAFVRDFKPAGGSAADSGEEAGPVLEVLEPAARATEEPEPQMSIPPGTRISERAAQAAANLNVDVTEVIGSGRHGRIQLQDVQRAAHSVAPGGASRMDNAVDLAEFDAVDATDIAKRLAQRDGLSFDGVQGSGRHGRIRVSDLPQSEPANEPGVVPFTNMRKQIARRLTASYQDIPHYYLQADVFVDALFNARAAFNAGAGNKTSINDWLVRAVALTLAEHPDVNIHVGDEEVVQFADANIAVAVAIDGGLITPVLKRAQSLSVDEIGDDVRRLAECARAGQLSNEDVSGGTFTISNLGMFGVNRFTALINPPQGAILAVGAAQSVATERDGQVVFAKQMSLTLGCDHRAIDGAMGGRFLTDLRARIEDPQSLLG